MSLRRRADERGMAMVSSVIIMMVMAMLTAVILTQGSHSERTSGRGRNWTQALHVAEAGVQDAVQRLESTVLAPTPFDGGTTEGEYSVTVTHLGRRRYEIVSTGTVGTTQGLAAERTIRVVMAPPPSFRYALFSLTDINTKDNNTVVGDVWANGSVTVDQNDLVEGSVTAATGWVFLDNGSEVTGGAWSGGADGDGIAVDVSTNAHIGGKVKASSTHPECSDDPGHSSYKVNVIGSIAGSVTTWGNKSGGGPTGPLNTHVCTAAAPTKTIPDFTWVPSVYDPAPLIFSSPTDFNDYLAAGAGNDLSGIFYVHGGGADEWIDLTGVQFGGDTYVIAPEAPIDANGVSGANTSDKVIVLASWYSPPPGSACTDSGGNPQDCAIGLKNNFEPEQNSAVLLYAPNGPVAFKNSAEFLGAVYASDIVLKNNQVTVYDERVEQLVGFGSVTLAQESWVEL